MRTWISKVVRIFWKIFMMAYISLISIEKLPFGTRARKKSRVFPKQRGVNGNGLVCRWGGEEFIAVIPASALNTLESGAGRLRALVEQSCLSHSQYTVSVTISVGATLAVPGDTVESVVRRADKLMLQSKKLGKNRVSVTCA